jgi:hypothetical protein
VRRAPLPLVLLALLAGCSSGGDDEGQTPVACLAPAGEYLAALDDAPDPVRLEGTTPISDCLTAGQDAAGLSDTGRSLVRAATELNREARRDPSGESTLRLGYLVGAVQQGASETGGIHVDLVRRLDAAARFNEGGKPLPVSFERTFGKGYAAGQENG